MNICVNKTFGRIATGTNEEGRMLRLSCLRILLCSLKGFLKCIRKIYVAKYIQEGSC